MIKGLKRRPPVALTSWSVGAYGPDRNGATWEDEINVIRSLLFRRIPRNIDDQWYAQSALTLSGCEQGVARRKALHSGHVAQGFPVLRARLVGVLPAAAGLPWRCLQRPWWWAFAGMTLLESLHPFQPWVISAAGSAWAVSFGLGCVCHELIDACRICLGRFEGPSAYLKGSARALSACSTRERA
jgi:hypothetical protein